MRIERVDVALLSYLLIVQVGHSRPTFSWAFPMAMTAMSNRRAYYISNGVEMLDLGCITCIPGRDFGDSYEMDDGIRVSPPFGGPATSSYVLS